jgi:CRISPR/Cas system-associated exonuclease Cas4 (RecB family)
LREAGGRNNMAKKLPREVKLIQEYKLDKPDKESTKNISFSQLQVYSTCPHLWYLSYPKKLAPYTPSIHTVFGTALHETIQQWLTCVYTESVKASNEIDLPALLEDRIKKTYKKERFNNGHKDFTTSQELQEFYQDGLDILDHLKKKRGVYFSTKGTYLAGVEIPLLYQLKQGVYFKGFIDLVFYNETTGRYLIVDIKTSTRGWSDYEKSNEVKVSQVLLYKEYFAQQFNVDVESIDVEYFIVRRKIYQGGDFIPKRVQSFVPASGKIKRKKAVTAVQDFINNALTEDGEYVEKEYLKTPSKSACKFCPFNKSPLCGAAIL